ncbi:hypothetical protein U1E44_01625 [Arenibacter sp. GZD96]|uniref:hypothetical protein n=1 Tax=Aurantibrevibacter litoralis TaxID=3106030 RepID=UPI002AFE3E20|nr:hypothetical protein [Arenibacter sp. GZD-96]MEA1784778.1 hypothetical protein [Arenibacter sp. GZD-96]
MTTTHTFHIPVMGIGYTIDTPLKVSKYGIDSVISLVDDILLERLRKMYSKNFQLPYEEITEKMADFRAKRITSYLNLIQELAEKEFEAIKAATQENSIALKKYMGMLPAASHLKAEFEKLLHDCPSWDELKKWAADHLKMGSIDVNIMTKIDKENYLKKEKLPTEYNDAHAALRGFAKSNLQSSVILSAGMNPRLYAYMEEFEDFYPDATGTLKKKIILKVSDYRSALIQGKFLAKKGLWVSEFRIESGLNCGGHAFATEGHLMGPILAQFRDEKQTLMATLYETLMAALQQKNRSIPKNTLPLKITAQGGVGTSDEHQFLLEHYQVDAVGWGTPFLLVPEATTVDKQTLTQLTQATEDQLYISNTSPLGVPFNTLKGNTKDDEKKTLINKGRPGSSCPKKFVALNKELTEKGICTASRQYQDLKIKALDNEGLTDTAYDNEYLKIVEKSCICVGLGTSALLQYGLDTKVEGTGVSICPGPNLAYFSKEMTLSEITDNIYGRTNVIVRNDRPHMFIKELQLYIDFLKNKIEDVHTARSEKQKQGLLQFAKNLNDGISYYKNVFEHAKGYFLGIHHQLQTDLENSQRELQRLFLRINLL